jgi:hypothetical protein
VRRLPLRLAVLGALVLAVAAPAAAAPSLGLARPGATWVAPLPGRLVVLRRFQPPPSPYAAGHRGVDLAAAVGTEVRAAGAGTVTFAAALAGRGVVTVTHGSLRTTYEPVAASVAAGQAVAAGQPVGRVGAPSGHCRPGVSCLHWGLLRGSTYLDPLLLLGRVPVRLLPLHPAPPVAADGAPVDTGGTGVAVTAPGRDLGGADAATDRAAAPGAGRAAGAPSSSRARAPRSPAPGAGVALVAGTVAVVAVLSAGARRSARRGAGRLAARARARAP